ncbi:MAG: hypothetical protein ACTHN3_07495 [Solirubrobacterales bacterium]
MNFKRPGFQGCNFVFVSSFSELQAFFALFFSFLNFADRCGGGTVAFNFLRQLILALQGRAVSDVTTPELSLRGNFYSTIPL